MWSFVTGFFHLTYFQGPSMLQHVPVLHFILLLSNTPLCGYTFAYFAYSSVNRHLCCFYFLAIMNNNVKNIHVQIFVWTKIATFLGTQIARSGIAGSYGNSMFNHLGNISKAVLQSSCPILYSHQELHCYCLSVFFILAILVVMYYVMVLICVSPMTFHLLVGRLYIFFGSCLFLVVMEGWQHL